MENAVYIEKLYTYTQEDGDTLAIELTRDEVFYNVRMYLCSVRSGEVIPFNELLYHTSEDFNSAIQFFNNKLGLVEALFNGVEVEVNHIVG